uniref:Ig-like domain-containing protein n=1 Tax=Amphimedon queenslandica TaxID=400682 RepID=A0A1X7TSP2_AMPQE
MLKRLAFIAVVLVTLTCNEVKSQISPTHISIEPNFTTVSNNENVQFNCTADGGPNNMFIWTKTSDAININTNGTISVEDIQNEFTNISVSNQSLLSFIVNSPANEGGGYTCFVFNEAGIDSANAVLHVNPFIVTPPQPQYAEVGERPTFTCVGESFPSPTYQWQRISSSNVITTLTGEVSTTYRLPFVGYTSFASYQCIVTANGTDNTITSSPALITISPRGSVVVLPSTQAVSRNGNASFICLAQGGPNNNIVWIRGNFDSSSFSLDAPVNVSYIINSLPIVDYDSSLSLTFVNGSDGGTYTCLVLNEAGVGSSSAILQVRPEIITDPVSTFTENGQSITFWCLADSFPSPQYYWERSNGSSNEFYIIPNENEQYLTIDSVVYEDNGRYRCNATAVMDTVRSNEAVLTISPSGSVEIDPGFTIATNGSTISFNCSARGGPNNSFFWTLSNATGLIANEADLMSRITMIPIDVTGFLNAAGPLIIENGTQLTLEYINATRNGGNYSCVVINEAGTSTVETTLYVAPIITLHPQDRLVTQGDNFMLSCLADAFPSPTYQWERMNQTSGNFEEITGKTSSNLRFNNVDFDEFGVYRCVASSEGITETAVSRGALVTVSPYGSLNATPATQIVSRNSSPTFTCEVSGGPNTTLVWIRGNGTNVQSTQTPIGINTFIGSLDVIVSETAPSLELSLQNVNGTNGGDYACIAVNEAGTDNGSVSLLIIPQILTNPVPQFVNVGQYLMLNCRADSFPAPNYQWEMMNRTSGYFEPLTGQTSYRLTLHIEYYLYGMYRCVATADGIEENGTSTPALVTVSPLDSVVVDPMNRTVSIGDTANFTCRAQGGPGNMFRWIKGNFNGPTLTAPLNVTQFLNSLSIFRSGYELSFTVGGGAADGGYYTCIVVNEAGYDTDNVSLLVRPQILTNPMPQYAEVGNNVTLTCEADSFPAPNYQWEMMNRTSGYFEHLNGQTSYVLILESISYEKYGMYRCVATTDSIEEKATSTPALVTVSPLDSVVADPEYRTVSINDTANFTCRAQGGPGNMFRWIKGNFTDPNLSAPLDVKQFLYNLSNITSDYFLSFTVGGGAADGGYYTCIVVNEAGYDTDNVSLLVRPQILTNPVAQYVNVDQQYVFLNCSADSFPAPNYQWEMMNRTSGYFEPLTGQTNYQLTLHIEYDLYGMYRCVATADGIKENATSTPALVTVSPLGSVNATPEYRTVSIGDTATFTCRAQGGPGNMFRWIKGIFNDSYQPVPLDVDKFLDDLDNITLDYFLSFTVSGGAADGGYYTCIVVNEAGYDTDNVTLYVSPVITLNPVDQYAHPGDTVIISCMADSYPPPTYQWQVLNTDTNMYQDINGETMTSYTIENIDYDQFGMYRCAVTTPIINQRIYSQPALITVSSNSSVTIDPDFIITENGSDVTFNCLSRGGPNNTFIWLRPSALDSLISNNPSVSSLLNSDSPIEVDDIIDQLSNITLSNEPTFTLYSINATEDGGNYACYVVNPAGVESNTTTLYVIPVITEDPREAFTNVSDTVTLNCRADSFPAPNYQWEMMNRTSGYFEPLTGQTSYQLTLHIEYDLYGMYRCVATADGIEENATSTPALVTANPPFNVMVSVSSTTVSFGDNVTFTCSAEGGSENNFTWTHNNMVQISDGGRFMIESTSSNSTLTVTDVIVTDFGTYICQVSNLAGSDSANLTITTSPEGFSTISPVNNITLDRGNDITLECNTTTPGPPSNNKYNWFHNATQSVCCPFGQDANITELLQQNTVSRVGMSSDLELTSVNASHGGTYECIISNDAGSEALSTSVFIRPYFVEQPPDNVYTEVDGNVTLYCNAESYPYPSFQWEKRNDAGVFVSISGETSRYLMFSSVTTDVIGEYRCIVTVDELDSSITSNVTAVHVSPQNLVTVEPSMIISEPSSDVTFTCNTTAGPNSKFVWLYNATSVICDDCIETFEDFLSRVGNLTNMTLVGIGPVLTLRNIDSSVGGTYHCAVINEAGFDIETASLYITPTIVTHPMSVVTPTRIPNIVLSCMANSFPDPEYRWEKSSTNEGPYTKIANSEGSTYALGTIFHSTNGYYRCIAYTSVSNIINETASNPAVVTVDIGRVIISVSSTTVSGGDNVTFTCSAEGGPDNIFTWTHSIMGQISDGGRFIIESTFFSRLTVTDVIGADFGTYTCMVMNLAGSGNAITEPITTSPEGFSAISPVNNITLDRGNDITLNCTTTAGPINKYSWFHNATQSVCCPFGQDANITELVEQRTVSRVGMNSDLELTSVNASHGGIYECILSNDAGSEALSTSVFIRPYFAEQPPDNVYTEVDGNVTLDCNAESYPYPSFQWEKKNDAGVFALISGETGRYLMFSSVTTDVIGEYRCIVTVDELDSSITSNITAVHGIH